ncbi:MAG: radical SAM protein [Elusimicrobia bacterium]|nr:radical SAM protein [Elusimicrobiota bacterium]
MRTDAARGPAPSLRDLERRLARVLLRSKLDYSDDLFTVIKFFIDLRWEKGWSAARLGPEWRTLRREAAGSPHLYELYFHFPYCKSRCSYCFTNSRVLPRQGMIDDYIGEIEEEARFFAPMLEGASMRIFAVGGGTPSLMSAEQLERFCRPAVELFSFAKGAMRSIELNPADTDPAKLRVLRGLGFTRVSFGVQSMTPETLRRVNRRQSFDSVKAAIAGAKAAGFESVGTDIIFGMVGEPLENFLDSFRRLAELRPTEISVCTLSLTDRYMKATRTTPEAYLRYYEENLTPGFEGVMRIARETGFRTPAKAEPDTGEWTVVDAALPAGEFSCREEGPTAGSMLGLGRGSRSQIFGRRVYERDWERFSPEAPLYRAAPMSRKDEMASYILANLEHGSRLNYAAFRQRFGTDVREDFGFELKLLKSFGQVEFEAETFHYLPSGVPQRVFWACVFALHALPGLPCGAGLFDGDLRARLERDISSVALGPS